MNSRRTLIACGVLSALLWALLTSLTFGFPPWAVDFLSAFTFGLFPDAVAETANGFAYEIPNRDLPTAAYLVLHLLLFGFSIAASLVVAKRIDRTSLIAVLVFGALFRAILIPSTPIHENDFYRYLWDGKSIAHGVNPYLFTPAQVAARADPLGTLFADPLAERTVVDALTPAQADALEMLGKLRDAHPELHTKIGHPNIPTIYPPASQVAFATSEWFAGGSVTGWKLFVVAFDLGTCVLVAMILGALGKNPSLVVLYAWSPLVIKEFANSGHLDSIPIFFTLLAIFLAIRHRRTASAVSLSVGTLGKFIPLPLLPVLVPPSKKWAPWLRYILFLTIVAAAYLPFFFWQKVGVAGVFSGLDAYNQDWEFFSGVFAITAKAVAVFIPDSSYYPAKLITAAIFAAAVAFATFSKRNHASENEIVGNCFVVIASFFVLNACAFPWYFTWVAPFLCFFPRPDWLVLGALLPLTYLSFHPADELPLPSADWLGFPVLSWIIWGTFLLVWIAGAIRQWRKPPV